MDRLRQAGRTLHIVPKLDFFGTAGIPLQNLTGTVMKYFEKVSSGR